VLLCVRPVILQSAGGSNTSYKFNLTSGAWSRFGANMPADVTSRSYIDGMSLRDPTTGRIYLIETAVANNTSLVYHDPNDNTWKSTATYSFPSMNDTQCAGLHDGFRMIWLLDISGNFWGLNLNNIAGGWSALTDTGTPTTNRGGGTYHAGKGAWYFRTYNQGSSISKLLPPASSPFSNTWTWSTESIGGDTIPNHASTTGDPSPYTALQYVPSIDCLAWFSTASASVALIQPS
jgi:hypothetical protein